MPRGILARLAIHAFDDCRATCMPRCSTFGRVFEGGVEGFTAAFTAGALGKQEKRSVRERSDPVWGEAEGAVLTAARQFQQA